MAFKPHDLNNFELNSYVEIIEKDANITKKNFQALPFFMHINLFAEQDKLQVNTTTQIVVQVRLMLMKKLNFSCILKH